MKFIELFKNIRGVKAATSTVGFNACHYAGADFDQVAAHKKLLADYFGVPIDDIYIPVQTHSTNVAMPGDSLDGVDAMVCNVKNKVIAINTADCLPLLLADVNAGVIAAVHCGWRGTVAKIAANAVNKMIELGADSQSIIAAMGPCIGTECFEVGEEVASQFSAEAVDRFHIDTDANIQIQYAKPHVDLAKAVAMQLIVLGINPINIARPIACSMCDERFHSVRREGRELPYRTLTAIKLV